ncbi:MAG: acyltransferase family protein [Pseudonocardia sp.]|nr:acyltransferase family protein [Pseudonocardia sp.]
MSDHTSALALVSGNELQRRRESKSTSDTAPVAAVTGRERWFDLLKVAALARVIASEVGVPAYLSLFPAWGVLFGIGGSMMARSAQHEPEVDVMGHRLRRVLVPLWAFGIVAVPLMLWQGWGTATDENTFYVSNLVFWIFPFLDPPGSTPAEHFTGGLWYVRACLWFVLLTPVMRAGMRRSPLVAMLLPLVVVGLDTWLNWDLSSGGGTGAALMDFCVYAPCWMFGMAYRDGSLRGIQRILVGVLAVVALAGGAVWTKLYVPELNIDDVPLSAALLSFGVVVPLLSVSPLTAWMDRVPVLRELLWLITGRALTIYLCYPIALAAAPLIAARLKLGTDARTATFITVGLVVLATLAFGWVEDLAARRPLGLLPPAGRRKERKDKPAGQPPPVPEVAQAPAASQQVRSSLGPSGPQEVPVLQGVGGPPVAGSPRATEPQRAVGAWSAGPQASGPHRRVGGWTPEPQAAGPPWPPVAPQLRPAPGPNPHGTAPMGPGPHHPGAQQPVPQAGPQPGGHGHAGPGHPGPYQPEPHLLGAGPHRPGSGPYQPGPPHAEPHQPAARPLGAPNGGAPNGLPRAGAFPPDPHQLGPPPGPQQPGRPGPDRPGPQQPGPPTHPPFERRPPDRRPPEPGPQPPRPAQAPPPRPPQPPPPPPAQRSGRPR